MSDYDIFLCLLKQDFFFSSQQGRHVSETDGPGLSVSNVSLKSEQPIDEEFSKLALHLIVNNRS